MENFFIVLFKNKVKKRIIKKFVSFTSAQQAFKKLVNNSENVIFPKKIENGSHCNFEIGLIGKNTSQDELTYKKDDFGRTIKVKLDNQNMNLIFLNSYNKEDKIFDVQENKKIETNSLIKKYIKNEGIKLVSSLHNKIIIQKDDEFYLFSTKNDVEANRFMDCLQKHLYSLKINDCILVKDYSIAHRKYLFDLLVEKGFDKKVLYRKFTTYPRSK